MAAKTVTKRMRFEVFKRDSFTCQYCGRKAPDVVLHVDHITPRSKGGPNDILNLVTSCVECNSGKSDRPLAETKVLDVNREQLRLLQERREQIQMMHRWQAELRALDDEQANLIEQDLNERTGFTVNDHGKASLKVWVKKYGFNEVLSSLHESIDQYWKDSQDVEQRKANVEDVFNRIPRVIKWKRLKAKDPEGANYLYSKGILRNRLNYINWAELEKIIEAWRSWDLTPEVFSTLAKQAKSWTNFVRLVADKISEQRERYNESAEPE